MNTAREAAEQYPTIRWIRTALRCNLTYPTRRKILGAFVVGSVARGTAKADSDLDIAVIIPHVRGKTSLRVSEEYHAHFASNSQKPQWDGRVVDVQFFYDGDPDLAKCDKIKLTEDVPDCKISIELSGVVWQGECKTHGLKWIQYDHKKPKQCEIGKYHKTRGAVEEPSEEEIRERVWNLCKQYDSKNIRRDIVWLRNFVSEELERLLGAATENLFRKEWIEEVALFCKKYSYTTSDDQGQTQK